MKRSWLSLGVLLAVHEAQIVEHGGPGGVRDRGLLESAVARPRNLEAYSAEPSVPELAAADAVGIIRNHPFLDANKRTGFVAMRLFLDLNGYRFVAPEAQSVLQVLGLAAGDLSDEAFTAWVVAHAAAAL